MSLRNPTTISRATNSTIRQWNSACDLASQMMARQVLDDDADFESQYAKTTHRRSMAFFCLIVVLAMTLAFPLLAFSAGERETVSVLAAKVRCNLLRRGDSPDAAPGLQLRNFQSASSSADQQVAAPTRQDASTSGNALTAAESPEHPGVEQSRPPASAVEASNETAAESLLPSLTLISPAASAGNVKSHRVIVATTRGCKPCEAFKQRNGVGNSAVDLEYVDVGEGMPRPESVPVKWWEYLQAAYESHGVPVVTWQDGAGEMRCMPAGKLTNQVIQWTIESPQNNPPHAGPTPQAAAVGGAMQTRGMIRRMFSEWQQRLGQDATVTLRLDKSGTQSQSVNRLMRGQPWPLIDVLGRIGHVSVSTTSTLVPLKQIGLTYKTTDGEKFDVDADPFQVSLPKVGGSAPQANGAYGIIGIDDLCIAYDVYYAISTLGKIMNPLIDVNLPGTIEATAKMSGDETLVVDLATPIGVHVDAWLRFDLDVRRVEITQKSVVVRFAPQPRSWIQIESREILLND